jgi:N-methylhydantoinase B
MFEFLDDGAISIEGDGHKYAPWGLNGGSPGSTAEINLLEESANKVSLPSKIPYMPLLSGTKIEVLGPNGGGYGPRSERDPKMVRADLDNEIITSKIAEEEYDITL